MKNITLRIVLFIIFVVVPIYYFTHKSIETFKNRNPYYSEDRTLKQMIAEMSHDALNDTLKAGPLLLNLPSFT